AAVLLPLKITSLWSMSAMTLFPVVLLSSPRVVLKHAASVRVLGLALAWPLLMAAASPAIAWYYHLAGAPDYEAHYRLIAQAVQRTWAENTDAPLRIVGSTGHIANALSFYLPGDQS